MSSVDLRLPDLAEERSWGTWLSRHVGGVFVAGVALLGGLGALVLGAVTLDLTVEGQGVLDRVDGVWTATLEVPAAAAGRLARGQELQILPLSAGGERRPALAGRIRALDADGRSGAARREGDRRRVVATVLVPPGAERGLRPGAPVASRAVIGQESAGRMLLRGFRKRFEEGEDP